GISGAIGRPETTGNGRCRCGVLIATLGALCLAADFTPAVRDAMAAVQRGDLAGAESKLRAELKLHPNDPDALSLLGVVLDNQRKFAAAEPLHKRAMAAAPRSAPIVGNYGNHLQLSGNERSARESFQQAIAIDRTDRYANLQLAQLALAAKDTRGALVYLDQVPATQRDDPELAVVRLAALEIGGNHDEAETVFERLSEAVRGNAALS